MKYFRSSSLSILIVCLLIVLSGCRKPYDPRLLEVERLMESHPDSALTLLEVIHLSEKAADYDRHLYNLLLIHARYKNFTDEENDSSINATTTFFLDKGDKKHAAEALYLSGCIKLNLDKIGESAVSFTKGMEMAKSIDDKFLEGQCARGLFLLHGRILDSSAQLQFAKREYGSFSEGNYQDWIDWSRLDIATAYSNNGQFLNALYEADQLIKSLTSEKDSLLRQSTLALIGTAQLGTHKYADAIKNYIDAYLISPDNFSEDDMTNLAIAISKTNYLALSPELKSEIDTIFKDIQHQSPFEVLEAINDYENAYKELKVYKDAQDTIIAKILHSNVSESLNHYQETRESLRKVRHLKERYVWILILFGVIITASSLIEILRKSLERKDFIKHKMEEDMENLKKDFYVLLEKKKIISNSFRNSIRDKYDRIDTLCDNYFEKRVSSKTNNKLANQINDVVAEFNDKKCLEKMAREVDSYTDGLYSSFKNFFPDTKEETLKLYLYLILGFGTRTISVIMDQEPSIIYNRKSRLKAKIRESNIERKEEHLQLL